MCSPIKHFVTIPDQTFDISFSESDDHTNDSSSQSDIIFEKENLLNITF